MQYFKTGIKGFDIIMDKGLPDGTTIILHGPPGTGIRVFGQQFIYSGLQLGAQCIYFTSERSSSEIKDDMKFYDWDVDKYVEKKQLTFIDAYTTRYEKSYSQDLDIFKELVWDVGASNQLRLALSKHLEQMTGQKGSEIRCMIDSLSSLFRTENPEDVIDLFEIIQMDAKKYGGIYLFILDKGVHDERLVNTLLYLADGIFDFSTRERGSELEHVMRVQKLKNMIFSTKLIPYIISQEGVVVETTERII
ncbi:MAG: MEDS domain-containing protein [Theionarchaea archaeon]|nr:MEDS domain-containing protein [Theionarchaea archaeon]